MDRLFGSVITLLKAFYVLCKAFLGSRRSLLVIGKHEYADDLFRFRHSVGRSDVRRTMRFGRDEEAETLG